MAKLSKQDKIDIFNLWQNYCAGTEKLSQRYGINITNINY